MDNLHDLTKPVAWSSFDILTGDVKVLWGGKPTLGPLYTSPPQRTWVGLTDEEIEKNWKRQVGTVRPNYSFTRAIEAKLKEKNENI